MTDVTQRAGIITEPPIAALGPESDDDFVIQLEAWKPERRPRERSQQKIDCRPRYSTWMRIAAMVSWVAASSLPLLVADLPINDEGQFAVAWIGIVVLAVLGLFERRPLFRTLSISVAAFVTLRYALWRSTDTLPPLSEPFSFVPGVILYGAEMFAVVISFLSLFIVIDPRRRKPSMPPSGKSAPTVDVLIPTYNEDPELVEVTIAAATRMIYPEGRLRVYLCDDGGTDQKLSDPDSTKAEAARLRATRLKEVCLKYGAVYVTRPRNVHAKAGNLNATFHNSRGDLVAIFDADHVPAADFLQKTVGFFEEDDKLFLVQTPHFFINPDPLKYNLDTFERMPSENEMFYGAVQPGLDRWNAAFFCGSAALLRRRIIAKVGGIVGETITEDCETALELHSRGYRSVYLAEPLVAGLQPETFVSFIGQRSRWAQGMLQIFLLKNPWLRRGLTLPQRLCYTSNNIHWLFAFARPIFMLSPLLYLMFGLEIYRMNLLEFFSYVVPHVVASSMLSTQIYGRVRWVLFSELYEYIQSIYLSRAMLAVIRSPRSPSFNVTSKGQVVGSAQLSPLGKPFVIIALLLMIGVVLTIWRAFAQPEARDILTAVGLWNLGNLVVALAAVGVVYERHQMRLKPRLARSCPAGVVLPGGTEAIPATVVDSSAGGLRLRIPLDRMNCQLEQGDRIAVAMTMPGMDAAKVAVSVRFLDEDSESVLVGGSYIVQPDVEKTDAVHVSFGDSRVWRRWWDHRHANQPGTIRGLYFFVSLAFGQGLPALMAISRSAFSRTDARIEQR